MGRAAFLERNKKPSQAQLPALVSESLAEDGRWGMVQRIVASRHFSRSPLLSRFLLYIVAETMEGRAEEITEHAIGVRVFDRPASYRTVEDNIVRNYARQLRKRLTDYYSNEGVDEQCRIDIPLGGYVPTFRSPAEAHEPAPAPVPVLPVSAPDEPQKLAPRRRFWMQIALFVLYTCALIAVTWFAAEWMHTPHPAPKVTDALWRSMLQSQVTTYIVPSDSGFNLLEDLQHQALPLADYISAGYLNVPLHALDDHSANDLRSQEFTSYIGLEAILAMERLPQFNPGRDILRFPRSLHLDDLKTDNVILFGSEDSNPWASLAEENANFRIVDQKGMEGARIVNTHPRAGEAPFYVSHWNEPSHETYALIEYLPNLGGTGHVLLLQGLDVAGTQAASEVLFHPEVIAPVLQRALKPDGTLRSFEILLRSTSIASNAAGAQVVTSRIY